MADYYLIPPKLYDDQFWWKKNDIEFWKSLFINNNKTVLEFAAGTGRLALPLIREGIIYSGVEISNKYVDYAHKKNNLKSIIQGDMRYVDLNQTFDCVFIGFNSFSHLLNSSDVLLFLDVVKRHMHAGSHFYIDVFIPHPSFLYRSKKKKQKIMDFFDSDIQKDVRIEETLNYDEKTEIISIHWNYIDSKKKTYRSFKFQMKAYYPDTMNRLLVDCGFYIQNIWGAYDLTPLNNDSDLQIYDCVL